MSEILRNLGFWLSRKINYPLISPDTLQISLTSRCNLRCRMCRVWEGAKKEDELSLGEIKSVIDQCKQWGVGEVNLCGGEPLLSDICFEIIDYAKSNNLKVILTTNGTLIDKGLARQLIESKLDIITISLDGAYAGTHDKIRNQSGSYDRIIQGIRELNNFQGESKIIKVLILTICNYNLDELEAYFYLAKNLCIDALYLTSLVLDNVKLYARDQYIEQNDLWIGGERLQKLDEMIDKINILQQKQYGLNYPSFRLIKKYFRREVTGKDWTCFAGYRRFVLVPGGTIQMCGEAIGNIRVEPSVRKIWTSEKAKIRRVHIKNCRNYCLQDCHAREESASLRNILKYSLKR